MIYVSLRERKNTCKWISYVMEFEVTKQKETPIKYQIDRGIRWIFSPGFWKMLLEKTLVV